MKSKSFPASSHQHSDHVDLANAAYVNRMFAFFVIGMFAFLGVAWMLESVSTAPVPEPTSLSSSIQP
jgi:L-ascorbate metabolism protein UlaG (beta-lactamase superfamily)